MSGAAIVIDVKGLPALAKMGDRLEKFAQVAAGGVLDVVGAVVESQQRRRLSDEKTAPDGSAWAPLSSSYAEKKKSRSSGGLLEDQGLLIDSITQEARGAGSILVGSARGYAATHQFGDDRTIDVPAHTRLIRQAFGKPLRFGVHSSVKGHKLKRNIPARPFIGISGSNETEIVGALNDHFTEVAGRFLSGEVR